MHEALEHEASEWVPYEPFARRVVSVCVHCNVGVSWRITTSEGERERGSEMREKQGDNVRMADRNGYSAMCESGSSGPGCCILVACCMLRKAVAGASEA
jgi:hypothetical protein